MDEFIDRATVLAKVRERVPEFSDKQLKGVIKQNPSLGSVRVPTDRHGSAYVYPRDIILASLSYAESAKTNVKLRAAKGRRIPMWLSRREVSSADNRGIIEPVLHNFLGALGRTGLIGKDVLSIFKAKKDFEANQFTPIEADVASMVTSLLVFGKTLLAPREFRNDLGGASSSRSDYSDEKFETARDLLSISLPNLFRDIEHSYAELSDVQLETARRVVSRFYDLLSLIIEDRFSELSRYGNISDAFSATDFFNSASDSDKVLIFGIFAVLRPFAVENFSDLVETLPAIVGICAVMVNRFSLEDKVSKMLLLDIPTLK